MGKVARILWRISVFELGGRVWRGSHCIISDFIRLEKINGEYDKKRYYSCKRN